jgi:hypothetical protein
MTMPTLRFLAAIPLFGRRKRHSFVPAKNGTAAARSVGQGRPSGRRGRALPWTDASTVAGLHPAGTLLCSVSLVAAFVLIGITSAVAEPPSAPRAPVIGDVSDPFAALIAEAAHRFDIPASWIRAVMRAESADDPHAVSPKGAVGLMQLMPDTWRALATQFCLGDDPFEPRANILAGAAYLRALHDRFGSPGFLAAYNAGPARYADFVSHVQPLPAETRNYLARLVPVIDGTAPVGGLIADIDPLGWRRAPLFPARGADAIAEARSPSPSDKPAAPGASSVAQPKSPAAVDVSALAPQSDGLFVRRGGEGPTP